MAWTALVPIRTGPAGKSRLKGVLDADARGRLALDMARHVIDVLAQCPGIDRIVVLSNEAFDHPAAVWAKDGGQGLNAEISAFRNGFGASPLLVIHADLPLLARDDVDALLDAATRHGAALATDRLGQGTNALALADGRSFSFQFGQGSRILHCGADVAMPVLQRTGLSADLDTPADLEFLQERGLRV
ncbi:MAG: 2-phospho-L-lactate guanylyltransferase [Croceicoccus sp.]|jgi:2-phospho-L-lactate guanylyltransferase|uniref:2-phospho-L-lactate guanylyltransferase n=1 Tax=Croceicoccus marinus TaxID=450378 RepID=A0A1Z1FFS1_9SPHN|nr:2-phospho-L-lactate guanylyltransferase [Croceicoccus marinus]ARU17651.1 2-phospho-L-lactate guanylyltransferase [Croceicoccus marinus]MAF27916.1 2-phospho-L-lactate guanylyltransferase [Croceicoccus sp.]MAL27854.1 2-phospho-L-lactate guanylyltransferase [Croceicoccus sp.]QNE07035.1 2-phospho-L-lactate guanylyltransferase [Croceicoccus marinus]|tara:strand:- start:25582 stop:26145 length:564 start_codon:yes stop_codon:yes gene_type:complete